MPSPSSNANNNLYKKLVKLNQETKKYITALKNTNKKFNATYKKKWNS